MFRLPTIAHKAISTYLHRCYLPQILPIYLISHFTSNRSYILYTRSYQYHRHTYSSLGSSTYFLDTHKYPFTQRQGASTKNATSLPPTLSSLQQSTHTPRLHTHNNIPYTHNHIPYTHNHIPPPHNYIPPIHIHTRPIDNHIPPTHTHTSHTHTQLPSYSSNNSVYTLLPASITCGLPQYPQRHTFNTSRHAIHTPRLLNHTLNFLQIYPLKSHTPSSNHFSTFFHTSAYFFTMSSGQKVESLRALMAQNDIDAYFVVTGDPHSSEISSPHDSRRAFISNFTGSAGNALITMEKALLWTDSRYYLQAEKQLDESYWELMKAGSPNVPTTTNYLANSTNIKKVGFDVMCIPTQQFLKMKETVSNIQFIPFYTSLIDQMWDDQPSMSAKPIYVFDKKYAGIDTHTKVEDMRKEMAKKKCSALLLSELDDVAWSTNLRGSDMEESPLFNAYFLITENETTLFTQESQITEEAATKMKEENIQTKPYDSMIPTLSSMNFTEDSKIWLSAAVNYGVYCLFDEPEKKVNLQATPASLAKAKKNEAEINGMIDAHLQDGMAMVKFFHWLEEKVNDKSVFDMSEYDIAQVVNSFRAKQSSFMFPSFPTICGSGANGAIVHYNPKRDSCGPMQPKMLLIDSGGQYRSGTTDVTRTTHLGTPTDEEKTAYTAVLKGHIALGNATFRKGITGPNLDCLARQYLWAEGLEYMHGTGHGVGAALNVHEGPCNISPILKGPGAETPLEIGMIISNEPGFYNYPSEFGIRIESLLLVEKAKTPQNFQNMEFYKFKTITKIPIDTNVIDFSMMTKKEIDWLNNYHEGVKNDIMPMFEEEQKTHNVDNSAVMSWLQKKTQAISF